MHISIPDTEEIVEEKPGSSVPNRFLVYLIHINGSYHCSARFSQLKVLYDQMKRQFGVGCLEPFPGKALFYIKPEAAHLRRYQLQKVLQKIASQPLLLNSETFQTFLLNAQKEVQRGPEEEVQLEVFLVNGKSVKIDIISTDQTDDVLETACSVIGLDPDLTYYFSLFLVEDASGKSTLRRLQDFESPYISLQRASSRNIIQLRRGYWDIKQDTKLYGDATALNLLYIQTIADIKNGWIAVDERVADDLASYRAAKDRLNFLRLARSLKGFGFQNFGNATSNVPEEDTSAEAAIGQGVLRLAPAAGKEMIFHVQRMRCWRTYSVEEDVEMEFEYYYEPTTKGQEGKMGWVQIKAGCTIFMAMCLQDMVEEMLRLRKGEPIKTPSDRVGMFKPRRQTNKQVDLSFLTDDTSAPTSPTEKESTMASFQAKLGIGKPKVAVTLSDLKSKVSHDDEDEDGWEGEGEGDDAAYASGGGKKSTKVDPDDYDSDEEGNGFASMAGF